MGSLSGLTGFGCGDKIQKIFLLPFHILFNFSRIINGCGKDILMDLEKGCGDIFLNQIIYHFLMWDVQMVNIYPVPLNWECEKSWGLRLIRYHLPVPWELHPLYLIFPR